jgi:hypothetical protein
MVIDKFDHHDKIQSSTTENRTMNIATPSLTRIVETIRVADVLALYESTDFEFTYVCFAIANILEQRGKVVVPDNARGNYSFLAAELQRFRDPYDYQNLLFPCQLSVQIEQQIFDKVKMAGKYSESVIHDYSLCENSLSNLRMLLGSFSITTHVFRMKILREILAFDPDASFQVDIGHQHIAG